VIVCFGDSLTAGYGAPAGQSYPDFLESDLIEQGLHTRVLNRGVSGATSKDALSQLPAVLALHPDVAVVEFGANDGLRGAPASLIRANLETILQALQQAHVRVMLAGIAMPPNYGPDYVQQFDAIYPALARKYKVPLMPFILKDVYGVPGLMSGDGIHPNGEGYQVIARNVMPVLLPLIKK
jgi:acyl-CoA thioesterase-1